MTKLVVMSCSSEIEFVGAVATPLCYIKAEMNDLIRDFDLSKETSKVIASQLKEKNLLQPGTNVTFCRTREKDVLAYLKKNLIFCNDVGGLR